MLVIFIYFLMLTGITGAMGMGCAQLLRLHKTGWMDKIWLGLGSITLLAGVWSLFHGLNAVFFIFLLILSIAITILYRDDRKLYWGYFNSSGLSNSDWLRIAVVSVIVTATATMPGYVLDNDSYYLQTIKWLNHYGVVPGIANWHVFLAQQSGFHQIEAALNLEFLQLRLNDVGLFLTWCMILWSIAPMDHRESTAQQIYRRLLVLVLPLLLLMGTAPSPDVPIILIHYYVIYKFLYRHDELQSDKLVMVGFLVGLACYFKITAAVLILIPLALFIQWKSKNIIEGIKMVVLPSCFAVLFLIKNSIASGYVLFPLTIFTVDVEWLMSSRMAQFYAAATESQAYGMSVRKLASLSPGEKLIAWLSHPGVEGYINWAIMILLFLIPLFIYKHHQKKKLLVVFAIFFLTAAILMIKSPQSRFLFPIMIPVVLLMLLYTISKLKNYLGTITTTGFIAGLLLLFLPTLLSQITDNPRMKAVPHFTLNNLLSPAARSRYARDYSEKYIGNIKYYDPQGDDFFYGTYDVPLPAAQEEYLDYFEEHFQVVPELRTGNLKDGFKARKIKDHRHK